MVWLILVWLAKTCWKKYDLSAKPPNLPPKCSVCVRSILANAVYPLRYQKKKPTTVFKILTVSALQQLTRTYCRTIYSNVAYQLTTPFLLVVLKWRRVRDWLTLFVI